MAKKSKNSEQQVHYARTMTPENLSRAANYVGNYILKGLGAFGKIMTAPLTGGPQGPSTVILPKTKEQLDAERKLRETQEQQIGKTMTWVSPLNYGAALATGNGLNARKGEEEVASWSPAWQAVGRLGELYVGPKAVKGVKSAPRVVVNTAAKAGVKPAKAAVVAREIKQVTKNKPNLSNRTISSERSINGITGVPEVQYTLYNEFGEPIGQTNIGGATLGNINRASKTSNRMVDGVYSKNKAHKVSEDTYNVAVEDILNNGGVGLESGWSLMSPQKTMSVTSKFPYQVIGYEFGNPVRLLTGNTKRPIPQRVQGNHYIEIKPKTTIEFDEISGEFKEVPIKENIQEPSTSLAFFERKPSKISGAERAGATKWERNFKPKWHVANYPGYQLKGLMKGSQLEKQLSKNGTININQLNAYFNKASQLEKEVASEVLAEKFAGQKNIDYNQFKKAVQGELINYSTKPQMRYSTYGMDRLGFNVIKESDGAGGIVEYLPGIRTNTFTFESPKLSVGSNKHYDTTTLGHSRTYTTPDEPNILHVMESQSDWGQSHVKMMPSVQAHQIAIEKALKSGNINAFHSFTNRLSSLMRDKLTKYERMALENINKEIESGQPSGFQTIEDLWNKKYEILKKASNRSNIGVQGQHLHDNYLQRQLQENLKYASEHGQTKMRYPTSETAAKIEGYQKVNHTQLNELSNQQMKLGEQFENGEISWEEYDKMIDDINKQKKELFGKEYDPKHQTILKKYADFPKLFQKLYKDQKVRIATDAKGNTWYEVDVPKGYLSKEWQFKQGGKMNAIKQFKKRKSY